MSQSENKCDGCLDLSNPFKIAGEFSVLNATPLHIGTVVL